MAEEGSLFTEAWNVGNAYSNEKIFKPLAIFDKLVNVALYGAEDIDVSLELPLQLKNKAKIEAMGRMVNEIKKVFNNSAFKIRKSDKKKFEDLEENLEELEKVLGGISKTQVNQVAHTELIHINEKHFMNCLNELRRIARVLIPYLNNAGFIYKPSYEVDLKSTKESFIHGG